MDWFVAILPVSAGAGLIEPGAPFLAEQAIGDELKSIGAARDAAPKEIPADADETSPAPADTGPVLADLPALHELRMAAIMAAVAKLGDADFTKSGMPRVAALKALLTFAPKASEFTQFARTD